MDRGKRCDSLKKRISSIPVLILTLLLQGCIFSYPTPGCGLSDNGIDEVTLTLLLHPSAGWRDSACVASRSASGTLRLVINIVPQGTRASGYELNYPESVLSLDSIPILLPRPVKAGEIQISVWADLSGGKEPAYDISSPRNIIPLISFGEERDSRMALTATAEADLTDASGSVSIDLPLKTPLGRYRIIASDYSKFMQATAAERAHGEKFSTRLKYLSAIPGSFDMITGQPMEPLEEIEFSKELPAIELPGIELTPVSDWLFMPEDGMETIVEVSVIDSKNTERARGRLSFPMRRGVNTIVRAPILTTPLPGISIDSIWNEEITIPLP